MRKYSRECSVFYWPLKECLIETMDSCLLCPCYSSNEVTEAFASSGMRMCCSEGFTSSTWKEGGKQFKKLLVTQGKDRTGSLDPFLSGILY